LRSWSRLPGGVRALALAWASVASMAAPRSAGAEEAAAAAGPDAAAADEPAAAPRQARSASEPAEQIVIVGRRPRDLVRRDPTASATVVEAERFAGEAKSVAELVATAPGVAVHEYGGLGHLATVSIRGSTADGVKVLLDGLPLNTAAGGGVDLSSIPRQWIERIEVVRGAEGAYYGSGALGGVVNVVTRPAVAGSWSATATGGSFTTGSFGADAAAGTERWSELASVSVEGSEGRFPYLFDPTPSTPGGARVEMRENDASLVGGGLLKASRRAGEGRLDLLAQLSGGRRELPGLPYGIPPGGSHDWQRDARAAVLARHSLPLSSGLALSTELQGRFDRLDVDLATLGGEVRQRDLLGGTRAEVTWLHGPGLLTAGGSAAAEQLEADGIGAPRSRPELSAWASESLELLSGRLRLAPGARVDRVGPFAGISAKVGATLGLAGPLSARASAGRSFRAPSFAELYLQQGLVEPNPSLRSEEAWSGDAALVADGGLGFASLGAFASLYRDLIVYEPSSFRRLKPFNDGKALVRGVEVDLATAPIRPLLGLAVEVAYTLLATETLRGAEAELGQDLPHRPRQRLYGRLALGGDAAGAHAEVHYVGRQFLDTRNLQPVPAALSFNAGGFVRLRSRPDVRLALEVKNVLGDLSLQDGFGNPLPGRMVLVTLRAGSRPDPGG
jgi:vitamin B12 transporter